MEPNLTIVAKLPLPAPEQLTIARSRLQVSLPATGLGFERTKHHLTTDIAPALSLSSQSSTYYGFVTGGATQAATFADHMAVDYDQNVQVHLPNETVATDVEDCALKMLCELLGLSTNDFKHRTFTTGATASNVIGLALGRQHAIEVTGSRSDGGRVSVAELGIFVAMKKAGIDDVQILTTVPHSSLRKAASIVGLGRAAVIDVSLKALPHKFDIELLKKHLAKSSMASIIAVSCAEVNTGFFATDEQEMVMLRSLCDQYGAWLHVDGAFGLLARALPDADDFRQLLAGVAGLEHADSITGDAHKLINVPYDCGFLFSRHLHLATDVFQNSNAAYLSSSAAATIPSPLNIGIENSRRFRALPVYATLIAYGSEGYSKMIQRQVYLTRAIAGYLLDNPAYQLLPAEDISRQQTLENVYVVVLFRARDDSLNTDLVARINKTRKIYVSSTAWHGVPACRFAVANWQADVSRDLPIVKEVLDSLV